MALFKKKPVVIEAITFAEFVEYGLKAEGVNIVDGFPWHFHYKGHPVTHENDECYIVPTHQGHVKFTPDDMLITQIDGEIYPCKRSLFDETYEEVFKSDQMFIKLDVLSLSGNLVHFGSNHKARVGDYITLSNGVTSFTSVVKNIVSDVSLIINSKGGKDFENLNFTEAIIAF